MSKYDEALSYLESFVDYERKPPSKYNKKTYSISRTEKLLNYLGNPHNSIKAIHITGTNGKGSTGAMLTSILKEAGFKTGFYSSPHLISFRERIRIGDELIPEEKICILVEDIKSAVEKLKKDCLEKPSFFEIYTAMAFLYFASEEVDFAVLEVGMGGRLDATNVVTPLNSIFTSIDIDHTGELGETRVAIAKEKSGIIKEGIPVITTTQKRDVRKVLLEKCREKNSVMTEVRMKNDSPGISSSHQIYLEEESISLEGCKFKVYGTKNSYDLLSVPLLGKHQILNAGAALCSAEFLGIDPVYIKRGLKKTTWPGRIQLFPGKPPILLDGAHNPAASRSLASTIKRLFPEKKIVLVFGICTDKDISGVGKELFPIAYKIILTKANNPRAAEPLYLKKNLARLCKNVNTHPNMSLRGVPKTFGTTWQSKTRLLHSANSSADAMKIALNEAEDESLVCVAGSFFLVGEILQYLNLIRDQSNQA